jgi:hypothetical protein
MLTPSTTVCSILLAITYHSCVSVVFGSSSVCVFHALRK